MYFTKCWAPCFTVKQSNFVTLNRGCVLIALWTAFLHFFSLTYAIALLTESVRTDVFYSPFFELTQSKTRTWSILLAIYSAFYIFCCSASLIHGIRSETRFFYFPWLYCTLMELLFMVSFGIFMVYRYYHYAWSSFASLILWFFSAYQGYLYWVVLSLYYKLKEKQLPTIIIFHH